MRRATFCAGLAAIRPVRRQESRYHDQCHGKTVRKRGVFMCRYCKSCMFLLIFIGDILRFSCLIFTWDASKLLVCGQVGSSIKSLGYIDCYATIRVIHTYSSAEGD